jgi:hypothetical protein
MGVSKTTLYLLLVIEWMVLWLYGPSTESGTVLAISWYALSLYQIFIALKNREMTMLIMFFFMMPYSYEPIRYFVGHESICWCLQSQNVHTVYTVALYSYIFNIVLTAFINIKQNKREVSRPFTFHCPFYIWAFCALLGLCCLLFGKTGETILSSGGYGQTLESGSFSTFFGYGVIPLITALIYSDNKFRRNTTIVLMIMFVVKDLLFGGRIDSIILIIASYIIYFRHVFSVKSTLILICVGFIFNKIWGGFRAATSSDITDIFTSTITNMEVSTDNSPLVYYASMRIIHLIDLGVLDMATRIRSLLGFLLSFIVPYHSLPPEANLSAYLKHSYFTGGGGLVSIFLYAWGGAIGVVLTAAGIGYMIGRFLKSSLGNYTFVYCTFVIATVPRWYAYYPIQLVKFCVIAVIFFALTKWIGKCKRVPA